MCSLLSPTGVDEEVDEEVVVMGVDVVVGAVDVVGVDVVGVHRTEPTSHSAECPTAIRSRIYGENEDIYIYVCVCVCV
jgi:hypothetical protein